jgi:uncharacterized protein (DUF4213/DUF364 family)
MDTATATIEDTSRRMGFSTLQRAYAQVCALRRTEGVADSALLKVAIKNHWNAVLGTGAHAGLAFNYTNDSLPGPASGSDALVPELRRCVGRPLNELVETYLNADDLPRQAVCLAALNALAHPLLTRERIERAGFHWRDGGHFPELVKPTDNVAVVGYGGLIRGLTRKCRELHVTDLRPRESFATVVVGEQVETGPTSVIIHPAAENRQVLAAADVVFITGATLVNGTFSELAGWAAGARVRAIYGPSAQLPPEFFFDHGLTHVLSRVIRDVAQFEDDMLNDLDMEVAARKHQGMVDIWRD